MWPAVILNKRSRIQHTTQAVVLVCSDPQTVCACVMHDQFVCCAYVCVRVCVQSGWHLMELWVSGGENEFKFSGELITITNPAVREQRPCYLKITFHLTLSWLF